jgi:RimJ/RimL family protein N-acetyltransferase
MDVPIVTPRLELRLLTRADASFVIELVNEPGWLRYIGDRNIHERSEAEAYIEKSLTMFRQHGVCLLAVDLKVDAIPIGICGLLHRSAAADVVDLGFAFLSRFHGQGFAHEAASAVLHVGHAALGHRRILAFTDPSNQRSIGLLTKLGFLPDGTATVSGTSKPALQFASLSS